MKIRQEIYENIIMHWPIHLTEIAKNMNMDISTEKRKRNVLTKIKYHINHLVAEKKVSIKKIGGSVVCWPRSIDVLRHLAGTERINRKKAVIDLLKET